MYITFKLAHLLNVHIFFKRTNLLNNNTLANAPGEVDVSHVLKKEVA